MCPTLFMDALQGKYANDTRWISREDFFRLRDTGPYVAMVWSFGNNMRDYLYSKEIEPLKKAIHYALFFSDYSLAKALGHDLSFVDAIKDVQQRYRAVKQYFSQFGHFQQQSFEGGGISARLETMERQQTRSVFQKKKKSKNDLGRCSTNGEQTTLHRLQYQKRPWEAEHRERTNCLTQIAISRTAPQHAQSYMGGVIYPSRPLCLATSKWLYRQIA
nr:MAG TPA: hypothetical protein [Caudoviricetes sp.]